MAQLLQSVLQYIRSWHVAQMVGIWAVTVWQALGSPPAFRLVELGPGRGTLMADALRGTAPLRAFADALSVHFVEVGIRTG